jgi:hypothetical protein
MSKTSTLEGTEQHRLATAAQTVAGAILNPMPAARELDHRHSEGMDVRLLWDARSGPVSIALTDERSGESLCFAIDPSEARRILPARTRC